MEAGARIYDQFTSTTVITTVVYILTIVIGGIGNTGIIFIYFRDKPNKKIEYHFLITNLAAADLIMSVCFTPLLLVYRVNATAMVAEKTPVCEMILFFSMTGISMQYFLFALLAKNRKQVILNKTQNSDGNIDSTKRNIVGMWLIAIVSGIVMVALARSTIDSDDGIPKLFRCLIINQSLDSYSLFFLGYSVSLFVIAMAIAAFIYKDIYKAFKMKLAGINASSEEKSRCQLTGLLAVIYTLFWTPFVVVQMLGIFGTYTEITFNLHAIASACGVSASATCIPLYYTMDIYYKEKLKGLLITNKTE